MSGGEQDVSFGALKSDWSENKSQHTRGITRYLPNFNTGLVSSLRIHEVKPLLSFVYLAHKKQIHYFGSLSLHFLSLPFTNGFPLSCPLFPLTSPLSPLSKLLSFLFSFFLLYFLSSWFSFVRCVKGALKWLSPHASAINVLLSRPTQEEKIYEVEGNLEGKMLGSYGGDEKWGKK